MDSLDPTGCQVHLWHSFTREKEATLRQMARAFESDNPQRISLRVEFHSPLHSEVLAAIAAGSPPDIVIVPCEQLAEYALLGAVVAPAEYVRHSLYGLKREEQADLWPSVLEGACLFGKSGQPLGIRFDSQIIAMFYNVDWLKRLKVDAPPRTWDDFQRICGEARDKKTGKWGYAYAPDGEILWNWISGLGGALLTPGAERPWLNSTAAIAAASTLRDLLRDSGAYYASDASTAQADFAAEKALFNFGSTYALPAYREAITGTKRKFNWDVAPMPSLIESPVVTAQGSSIGILRSSPRQQLAAWLFIRWLIAPAQDVQWALATHALPLHKSSQATPEMQAYIQQNPQYGSACQLLSYVRSEPAVQGWTTIHTLLADASRSICLEDVDPAEVLTAADTAAQRLLSR